MKRILLLCGLILTALQSAATPPVIKATVDSAWALRAKSILRIRFSIDNQRYVFFGGLPDPAEGRSRPTSFFLIPANAFDAFRVFCVVRNQERPDSNRAEIELHLPGSEIQFPDARIYRVSEVEGPNWIVSAISEPLPSAVTESEIIGLLGKSLHVRVEIASDPR